MTAPTFAPLEALPACPAPVLACLPDGSGVLLEDWKREDCPAHAVPAGLLEDVRRALALRPLFFSPEGASL